MSKRLKIKAVAATSAFVPTFLELLILVGFLPKNQILKIAITIFNFPAFELASSVKILLNLSTKAETIYLVIFSLAWAIFISWVFWRIAGTFMGEDEPEFETDPERAKFDWVGFRVRFVIGFIIGFLSGWRLVKNTTNYSVMFTAMTLVGLFVGLAFGLYRPNFWSRP